MTDVGVVVSFLGAYLNFSAFIKRTTTTLIADALPCLFSVMRTHGVKRILALLTPSYYVSPETYSWKWWFYLCMPPIFAPQGNAEMKGIATQIASQEDLDWTIFRVPHLTVGDEKKEVFAGLLSKECAATTELTRESLVKWVLKEIEEGNWVKRAPAVANL
ncbi:hypothetical protein AOQ84DRAFT_205695 [Glonium stellatum]|uniref:NAD(P)-binding domain-containing protein n=1 Tax=Glonium stellatum TaxID=574774 RepID=A0A8E2JVE5_9PEZI|nr:hypothetical protein AOQ84DRAFT_205695 [Glonium stellatum]